MIFDFALLCTIDEYAEKIAKPLRDIDIAMIFLNAGVGLPGVLKDVTFEDVQS